MINKDQFVGFNNSTRNMAGLEKLVPGNFYEFELGTHNKIYGFFKGFSDGYAILDPIINKVFTDEGLVLKTINGETLVRSDLIISAIPSSKKEYELTLEKDGFLQEYLGKYVLLHKSAITFYGKLFELRQNSCLLLPVLTYDFDDNTEFTKPLIERENPIQVFTDNLLLVKLLSGQESYLEKVLNIELIKYNKAIAKALAEEKKECETNGL